MLEQDAPGLIIEAVGDRRVGLEFHSLLETVDVYAGDLGHLRLIIGLTLDDGGQDGSLFRRQALLLRLGDTVGGPELVPGLLLLVQDIFHRGGPVHLVGVGEEQGEDVLRREAVGGEHRLVVQGLDDIRGIDHQLLADLCGEVRFLAEGAGQGEAGRGLPAVVEHAGDIDARVARLDQIAAGLQVLGDLLVLEGTVEAVGALDAGFADQRAVDFADFRVGTDEKDRLFAEVRQAVVAQPAPDHDESEAKQDGGQDTSEQQLAV